MSGMVMNRSLYSRFLQLFRRKTRRQRIIEGLFLGALLGLGAYLLGVNDLMHFDICTDILIIPMLLGVLLANTRARLALRIAAAGILAILLIVGYTPLASFLIRSVVHRDPLKPASTIVVLSSYLHRDKTLNDAGQERVLQAYLLLRQGYSPCLTLTDAITDSGTQVPTIREQMRALGLNYPIEVTGPVRDTHDEALAVARLARERHWDQVILVTHPWHMLRARAVFLKAGVRVLCSPCVEGNYDLNALTTPAARLHAFRDWLHEIIGYMTYRLRGWI